MDYHSLGKEKDTNGAVSAEMNAEGPAFESLEKKIHDLFTYRMFPQLMNLVSKPEEEKNEFYQKLITLQASIYFLDAHLEKNWRIDDAKRGLCWQEIFVRLQACTGNPLSGAEYVHHIKKYEKHEMAIRRNVWPTRYTMSYFYFYKSCDVKLLRRLIYEYGDLESRLGSLAKWRYFDFITEVNDDVSDVYEDLPLWNGNRFLIHLLSEGKKTTRELFQSFILDIESMAVKKAEAGFQNDIDEFIFRETMIQCSETREKINEMLDVLDLKVLKKESALNIHLPR